VDDVVPDRLRELLREDPVPEVRREAARALGALAEASEVAVDALIAALDDPNDGVRRSATLALGRAGGPRAAEALVRTLTEHPELWQEASAALAGTGERGSAERLAPLLEAESSHVRSGAIRAIAALRRKRRAGVDDELLFVYVDEEHHRHPLF
jgi:HEAT repeat protein